MDTQNVSPPASFWWPGPSNPAHSASAPADTAHDSQRSPYPPVNVVPPRGEAAVSYAEAIRVIGEQLAGLTAPRAQAVSVAPQSLSVALDVRRQVAALQAYQAESSAPPKSDKRSLGVGGTLRLVSPLCPELSEQVTLLPSDSVAMRQMRVSQALAKLVRALESSCGVHEGPVKVFVETVGPTAPESAAQLPHVLTGYPRIDVTA